MQEQAGWTLYIVECDDGSLYTGITNNVERRMQQHASGKGAKFFRTRAPRFVVYLEAHVDRNSALRREYAIKRLARRQKQALIQEAAYRQPIVTNA